MGIKSLIPVRAKTVIDTGSGKKAENTARNIMEKNLSGSKYLDLGRE